MARNKNRSNTQNAQYIERTQKKKKNLLLLWILANGDRKSSKCFYLWFTQYGSVQMHYRFLVKAFTTFYSYRPLSICAEKNTYLIVWHMFFHLSAWHHDMNTHCPQIRPSIVNILAVVNPQLLFKQRTIHGGQCSCFDITTIFHLPHSRRQICATKHDIEGRGINYQSKSLH
jgi:hypothetical protein